MNEVYAALAKVQAELPGLKKSATNPHFKSKYIPLDAIHEAVDPLLAAHGLLWTAFPCRLNPTNEPGLHYQLVHVESGNILEGTMPLLLDKQNSQGVGSAITYARRYALSAVLGIIADEDDDGNKASTPSAAEKSARQAVESFTDQVRATGKKAAEIREWAGSEGYTLDDVGVDAKGLTKFLNGLQDARRKQLLEWAK